MTRALQLTHLPCETGGQLGIDSAINVFFYSISSIIVQKPLPIFVEYIFLDVSKESTSTVVCKVKNEIDRLESTVRFRCATFVSD